MKTLRSCCSLLLLLASTCFQAALAAELEPAAEASPESVASDILATLTTGDSAGALAAARDLSSSHPNFALGQWLFAELAVIDAMDPTRAGSSNAWSRQQVNLILEARTRLELARKRELQRFGSGGELIPRSLAHLGNNIRDAIVVDLAHSELLHFTVYQGVPTLHSRHYVSGGSAGIGKRREGDLKTPLGVYRIDGARADASLPELYGAGALTLDYPNALDRALGRTGHGIWLHGVPRSTRNRAPWSSEGCVTMSNEHLLTLMAEVNRAQTVVVLSNELRWVTPREAAQLGHRWRAIAESAAASGMDTVITGTHPWPNSAADADAGATLANDSLLEVPDVDGARWLAWLPGDTDPGGNDTAWRFLPLPDETSPKPWRAPALSDASTVIEAAL